MNAIRSADKIESSNHGKSWASRLYSVLQRVSLCDLLLIALLGCWLGSRLNLIVNHGLVGGHGDESHRLVFSYRLYHNFSAYIYSYFFHNPWPPLPYLLQGAAFRIQKGLGLSADFGTAAVCSSVLAYAFAVALTYAAIALRFQRLAGLIAAALLVSLHEMTTLAVTPMAESYCAFFLALAYLIAALPRASRCNAVLIGLAVMLAAQCRSEIIVLGMAFGIYCFFRSGRLAGAICLAVTASPLLLKTIVNHATGFSGMSYFNLAKYYRFETSWDGNALKAFEALKQYGRGEVEFGGLVACLLGAALCGAALYRTLKAQLVVKEPGFRSSYFWLLVGAAGTLIACIVLAMAGGLVLPFPRYFVICHFLVALPLSVALSLPLARLSELYEERAALWKAPRRTAGRLGGLAVSLACAIVITVCLVRGAMQFRTTAVMLYEEQRNRIPEPILAASDWLHENSRQGHVCFDSLLWWESFLFFHNLKGDEKSTQFMVYDRPPGDWQEGLEAEPGDYYVAVMQRYVEAFRPELFVMAGPKYLSMLESIEKFADLNEKSSYLRPFIEEREYGTLVLKGSPYWKKAPSLSVTLHPAFENDAVVIYRASYSDEAMANSASNRVDSRR